MSSDLFATRLQHCPLEHCVFCVNTLIPAGPHAPPGGAIALARGDGDGTFGDTAGTFGEGDGTFGDCEGSVPTHAELAAL